MEPQDTNHFQYHPRACDCCGSDRLESVYSFDYLVRQRTRSWSWQVRDVVCQNCGFALVAPAPSAVALRAYYGDSFAAAVVGVAEFSIAKRLEFLRVHSRAAGRYVEIGANNSTEFVRELRTLFDEVVTIEINDHCTPTSRDTASVDDASANVVASYFVLEHVVEPELFLRECRRLLRPDGVLVLEIPDIDIYPRNPAALYWWEHVNHFSPRTLARIAGRAGFSVFAADHQLCSRGFGFVAALRVAEPRFETNADPREVAASVAAIRGGAHFIDRFIASLHEARARINDTVAAGKPVVIWAANQFCARLVDDLAPDPLITVVDIDPLKRDYLSRFPAVIPAAAKETIRAAGLFIICSAGYAESSIKPAIAAIRGRPLEPAQAVVIGWDTPHSG